MVMLNMRFEFLRGRPSYSCPVRTGLMNVEDVSRTTRASDLV